MEHARPNLPLRRPSLHSCAYAHWSATADVRRRLVDDLFQLDRRQQRQIISGRARRYSPTSLFRSRFGRISMAGLIGYGR